jgi:hypothetical protein
MNDDGKWKTVENGKPKEIKEKTAPGPPPGPKPKEIKEKTAPGPPPGLSRNFAASFGAAAEAGITPRFVLGRSWICVVSKSPTPNCSKEKITGGKGRKAGKGAPHLVSLRPHLGVPNRVTGVNGYTVNALSLEYSIGVPTPQSPKELIAEHRKAKREGQRWTKLCSGCGLS